VSTNIKNPVLLIGENLPFDYIRSLTFTRMEIPLNEKYRAANRSFYSVVHLPGKLLETFRWFRVWYTCPECCASNIYEESRFCRYFRTILRAKSRTCKKEFLNTHGNFYLLHSYLQINLFLKLIRNNLEKFVNLCIFFIYNSLVHLFIVRKRVLDAERRYFLFLFSTL